jgi:hypothetical protein
MNFKIIDDFIPVPLQEEIKSTLLGPNFAWFYNLDVTYDTDAPIGRRNPGFSYLFNQNDSIASVISTLAYTGATTVGIQYKNILQARAFLQLPLSGTFLTAGIDPLHVDTQTPHLVVLYYVIDSDGDTLLTDAREISSLDIEDHTIIARVTPKQGRAVLFDGSLYHTAEQPKNNVRCVINLDLA